MPAPPRPRPKADRDRCGLQRKRRNGCQIPPIVEPSLRFFVTLSVSPRRRPLYVDEAGLGALTSFLVSGSVSLAGSCSGPKRPQAGSGLALIGFFAFSFVAPGPLFLFFCNALIFHLGSSVFLTLPSLLFLRFFFLFFSYWFGVFPMRPPQRAWPGLWFGPAEHVAAARFALYDVFVG